MRTNRARTGRLAVLAAAALIGLAGCAGGTAASPPVGADGTDPAGTAPANNPSAGAPRSTDAATGTAWTPPTCDRPEAPAPTTTPVDGVPSDVDVTSFDGTRIRAHWFPLATATADRPAPTILMGPGWSLPGDTDTDTVGVFGALNISTLRGAGFNVLTWDPRGFGKSEGIPQVDSKDFEARDVGVLLDWVAGHPGVQLDDAGDPRVGMIGGSYGGGIQLTTAPIDCRVDALVPVVAWHSLRTSLDKADTPKTGWANILVQVGGKRPLDPHTTSAAASANATGTMSDEDLAWFEERGPGDLVGQIRVPTLFVHGTVDTLFTLDEAITNYRILRDNGVPTGMVWFCGGHGACLSSAGDPDTVATASIAWLKRWVQDDTSVDTGPTIDLIDQHGNRYAAADYPLAEGEPIKAEGSGTLALIAEGGAGPVVPKPGSGQDLLGPLVLPVTPAKATNAVEVGIDVGDRPELVVGAPMLRMTYRGTVPDGERPTRVFAQVVDETTALVLGNQITPIPVTLDGREHTLSVPLEVIAHLTKPGDKLTLQIVATTVAYAEPRLGGEITISSVELTLPVAADIAPKG